MTTRRRIGGKPPKTADAIIKSGRLSSRRGLIVVIAVVVVAIALAIILSVYFVQYRPMQQTVIKVNDSVISIGYLIRRLEAAGTTDTRAMLKTLIDEELIRQAGPRLGIEITDEEIDEALRLFARGDNEFMSDAEYKNWYRIRLNESQLNDSEFKELWRVFLIGSRIREIEAAKAPTVAEQVRLSYILAESYEAAAAVFERLAAGEVFADLAAEVSIDAETASNGGEMGWFPLAALGDFAKLAFQLEIGEYTGPMVLAEDGNLHGIFLATDRAASREIDADTLAIVRSNAIVEWLSNEAKQSTITYHGRDWSVESGRYTFGSETQAWIMWQLAKRTSINRQTDE